MQHWVYSTQSEKQYHFIWWMSEGQLCCRNALGTEWAFVNQNTFLFPRFLQELTHLCVVQSAIQAPRFVMQSQKKHIHVAQINTLNDSVFVFKIKEQTSLLSSLAVRSQISRSCLLPAEYKQLKQKCMPLKPSIYYVTQ